jgi:hypothetical protein
MPFAEIDLEKYLLPWKIINSYNIRVSIKPRCMYMVWGTLYHYGGNLLKVSVDSLDKAKSITDKILIEKGYVLLTEEQAKKYLLLL